MLMPTTRPTVKAASNIMNGSLDSNVLMRLILNDVPDQHECAKKLVSKPRTQYYIADTAVIELVFALHKHYGFTRQQVAEAIFGLVRLGMVDCNRTLVENALHLFLEHTALSFEDCCLATYATLNNAEPLWTFDKKLSNQAPSAKLLT
jgi:predicted nucleic-acid-binding protein